MQTVSGRNARSAQRPKSQRAKQGHHAKHVVKKTCSVSAEQPRFVVHHCRAADHMVEAGVIGVKTAQAEQKQ